MEKSPKLLILFLFLFVADLLISQKPVDFIYSNLETALEKAEAEGKNIFIETFTRHCAPCKLLDKELRDPELSKLLNDNFVNVKVNMNGAFARDYQLKYSVVFLPTIIFLNTSGDVLWKLDRLASANELIAICNKIIHPQVRAHRPSPPSNVSTKTVGQPRNEVIKKENKPTNNSPTKAPENVAKATVPKPNTDTSKPTPRPSKVPTVSSSINKKKTTTPTSRPTVKKEDINEEEGKILYVLGQGGDNLPPHVLRQESYFRMQLMDGSHKETAQQYMATQEDWLSKINIRFLHDFLDDARSGEFNFLIANKDSFYTVLGREKVDQTLNILVNKELERAYPRPDQQRATALYGFIDNDDPELAGLVYSLHSEYEAENMDSFLSMASEMNDLAELDDHLLLYRYTSASLKSEKSKKKLKKLKVLAERALQLEPDNTQYKENLDAYMNKL